MPRPMLGHDVAPPCIMARCCNEWLLPLVLLGIDPGPAPGVERFSRQHFWIVFILDITGKLKRRNRAPLPTR